MTTDPTPTPPPLLSPNGHPLIIAVIGGGEPPAQALKLAEEVGRELAERGVTVVCGGLRGVMEAVARGAKSAGGTTIGILPGNEPITANDYIDYPIMTGMGYARNVIVVKTGRAAI
ncbi:MAG: DNA-processing protein DprA, partial [Dehalococcoidia bacterium]